MAVKNGNHKLRSRLCRLLLDASNGNPGNDVPRSKGVEHQQGNDAHPYTEVDLPSMNSVRKNIERFAALGLKVDITELDIRMKGAPTPERLRVHADAYAAVAGELSKL